MLPAANGIADFLTARYAPYRCRRAQPRLPEGLFSERLQERLGDSGKEAKALSGIRSPLGLGRQLRMFWETGSPRL